MPAVDWQPCATVIVRRRNPHIRNLSSSRTRRVPNSGTSGAVLRPRMRQQRRIRTALWRGLVSAWTSLRTQSRWCGQLACLRCIRQKQRVAQLLGCLLSFGHGVVMLPLWAWARPLSSGQVSLLRHHVSTKASRGLGSSSKSRRRIPEAALGRMASRPSCAADELVLLCSARGAIVEARGVVLWQTKPRKVKLRSSRSCGTDSGYLLCLLLLTGTQTATSWLSADQIALLVRGRKTLCRSLCSALDTAGIR